LHILGDLQSIIALLKKIVYADTYHIVALEHCLKAKAI